MSVHLPIVDEPEPRSPIAADGRRSVVHPADVHGRFARARNVVFAVLIGIWAALPWITIHGHPAVFLDVPARRFFLFGATFNAQDTPLLFLLAISVGLALLITTALVGRGWCGWACPQTVFLDGVFRKIERLVDGPREVRMRRASGPWTFSRGARSALKHGLYVAAAFLVAHVFASYFVSTPALLAMVRGSPSAHPEAFGWAAALTVLFYLDFAFFREQLCLGVCPYGRLQSVLVDRDTVTIGYDARRGEPRGKAVHHEGDAPRGDCVDCQRCVVVCPAGIDIRNGLQLDCTACTACVDACDEIMDRLHRPRGLVRYDSQRGFSGEETRRLRPRLAIYAAAVLLVVVGVAVTARTRVGFEASILRLQGPPFVVDAGIARNAFELHIVNKHDAPVMLAVTPEPIDGVTFTVAAKTVALAALGSVDVPIFVSVPVGTRGDVLVRVHVTTVEGARDERVLTATALMPSATPRGTP